MQVSDPDIELLVRCIAHESLKDLPIRQRPGLYRTACSRLRIVVLGLISSHSRNDIGCDASTTIEAVHAVENWFAVRRPSGSGATVFIQRSDPRGSTT